MDDPSDQLYALVMREDEADTLAALNRDFPDSTFNYPKTVTHSALDGE